MKYTKPMNEWQEVFAAMARFKDAIESYKKSGRSFSELTRDLDDPMYRAIQKSGMELSQLGGYDAMRAAQGSLWPDDPSATAAMGTELNYLWNGIDRWLA
ncbi:hypothetical protein [Rhodobacter capsulatus]|uniref:hypothetical protein n=1 Tax=Rhodobacter capsulatus TaxID=1061 RepID=UPI004027A7F8